MELYLANKQKKQRHSTSQICANAEQRYILLCSVARHFQDTASEKVERLQHRHSLHKEEVFKQELRAKRENGILAGILIASTYSACNLHLYSQIAAFSISAFLSYSFHMTAACLAQSQAAAILSDRIRLYNAVTLI